METWKYVNCEDYSVQNYDVGFKNGTSTSHSLTSGNYDKLFSLT